MILTYLRVNDKVLPVFVNLSTGEEIPATWAELKRRKLISGTGKPFYINNKPFTYSSTHKNILPLGVRP